MSPSAKKLEIIMNKTPWDRVKIFKIEWKALDLNIGECGNHYCPFPDVEIELHPKDRCKCMNGAES